MSGSSFMSHAAAAIAGAVAGALLVLAVDGLTRPSPQPAQRPAPREHPVSVADIPARPGRIPVSGRPDGIVLAWAPGGMPASAEEVAERVRGVVRATTVGGGLDWIKKTRFPDGSVSDAPPPGMLIPFETAAVRPAEYARFVAPSERQPIQSLGPGEVVLAQTAARMRGAEPGAIIVLRDRKLVVTGIVSDVTANGYEGLIAEPYPQSWTRIDRFVLVRNRSARRKTIEQRLGALLPPGTRMRVRLGDEQPFLRYGDAVQPQMIIKANFGEFAAQPLPDGRLAIDPRWQQRNIVRARVPLLGEVTCHRSLLPQLRRALRELKARGLGHLIQSYNGCYSPRFIRSIPTGRISHHSWGMAIDLNTADNPFGSEPNMPPGVIETFERWGFTWGGRWLIPDGMHFEWTAWP